MSKDVKDNQEQEELNEMHEDAGREQEATEKEECRQAEESDRKLAELNDKYLRLSAEFDNYRKRTLKERMGTYETCWGTDSGKNSACYG